MLIKLTIHKQPGLTVACFSFVSIRCFNMMDFNYGQKVLCVNDHYNSYCKYPVKKGSIYTIHGFFRCSCGSRQVTLKEYPEWILMSCKCLQTSIRRQSFYEWRFIPIEYFENFILAQYETEKEKAAINECLE